MPKLYEEKPTNDELFLRAHEPWPGGRVDIDLVDTTGIPVVTLARVCSNGLEIDPTDTIVSSSLAARADMADAFDANGRLKVIGGEAEETAERMAMWTQYKGLDLEHRVLRVGHIPELGAVRVSVEYPFKCSDGVTIRNEDLVDLHARIGRHIAFLKKEGKL